MAPTFEQTILVTGANGYLSGHIIKAFLERGYCVLGTVRSPQKGEGLESLFEEFGNFSVCTVADFSKVEDYRCAFENVEKPITGVIPVASPVSFEIEDNDRDLIQPAIAGMSGILQATKRYGRDVQRLVYTSSHATIVDIAKGTRPGYTYTEKVWWVQVLWSRADRIVGLESSDERGGGHRPSCDCILLF
jgi:nucleoside-diphosphate-sugar epimerase